MRTDTSGQVSFAASQAKRLLVRPIRELPAGCDDQIAHGIGRLRIATGLSPNRIAAKLTTSLKTLDDLERGAVSVLPDWPETARIVRGYGQLARMDARVLLKRIEAQLAARDLLRASPQSRRQRRRRAAPNAQRWLRPRRRIMRRVAWALLPAVALLSMAFIIVRYPAQSLASADALPEAVRGFARTGMETVVAIAERVQARVAGDRVRE